MKNIYLSAIALTGLFYFWPMIASAEFCPSIESFQFKTGWDTRGYYVTPPPGWTLKAPYYNTSSGPHPDARPSKVPYQWANTELLVSLDKSKTIVIGQVRCLYSAITPNHDVDSELDIIIGKNIELQTGKTEAQFLQSGWIKSPFNYPSLICTYLEQDKCIW